MSGSSVPEMLFAELVNTLTDAALRLDPRTRSRLLKMDGHQVNLVTELPAPLGCKTVGVRIAGDRLQIVPEPTGAPNAVARGSLTDFLGWFASAGTNPGNMTIEGDEATLQEIATIFRGYAPDVAAPLGAVLGNDVAENLLGLGEAALASLKSVAETAGSALRHAAGERYATREDLDAFLATLDDTRSRIDRLAARVTLAEARSDEAQT